MKDRKKLVHLILFAMYGAVMFVSKVMMEALPNIHPLTMFIMVFSLVYGVKALIPTYIYVFINGLYSGFNAWWVPYLYIWALQCLVTCGIKFIIKKFVPKKHMNTVSALVYPVLAMLFGITFGILYAPVQALMFHFTFSMTVKWILTGLYFDITHAIGNFCIGLLIMPLSRLLLKLHKMARIPV